MKNNNTLPLHRYAPEIRTPSAWRDLWRICLLLFLPVIGNVHADIYVVNTTGNSVGRYDVSGAALATINASFISSLNSPQGAVLDGKGALYVVNNGNNTVGKYDAASGSSINASFITGLNSPKGIATDSAGNLYIVNSGNNTIGKYAASGTAISASLISGLNSPAGIAISNGNIYVANNGNGTVGKYTLQGVTVNAGLVSVAGAYGIALDAAENLYVSSSSGNTVGKYKALTGVVVNASFITGLNGPRAVAIDGGYLYVANNGSSKVYRYTNLNGTTATLVDASGYITSTQGLNGPGGLALTACTTTTNVSITSPQKVIMYPTGATQDLIDAAEVLRLKLNAITGLTYTSKTYNPGSSAAWTDANAIILGKGKDLNIAELPDVADASSYDAKGREHYVIGSAAPSGKSYIFIVGTTDWAVSRGVYDFMQQLGCRWFFPGTNWTVTPSSSSLTWSPTTRIRTNQAVAMPTPGAANTITLTVTTDETPDYKWRFWSITGAGYYEWYQNWLDYRVWAKANRMADNLPNSGSDYPQGLAINVGAAYGMAAIAGNPNTYNKGIAGWSAQNQPAYAPSWNDTSNAHFWSKPSTANVPGIPGTQIGVSNQGVEAGINNVITGYVPALFASYPKHDSVSMEANDDALGLNGWCKCYFCQGIQDLSTGYVTNRVVYLANMAVPALPPNKYVSYCAYSLHHAAPGAGLDPATNTLTTFTPASPERTYVALTTGLTGTQNVAPLTRLPQWRAAAPNVNMGIYDFLSMFFGIGGYSTPGWGSAADLSYVTWKPALYRDNHADIYIAETPNDWGPSGLGRYLLSKTLWKTTTDSAAAKADFISKSFGAAAIPMTNFYGRIDTSNKYVSGLYSLTLDLLGRLHRDIQQARTLETNANVVKRLNDLTVWLVYCELFKAYKDTPAGAARQAAFKKVLRFAYRIRTANMADSAMLFQKAKSMDTGFAWPEWNDASPAQHPPGYPSPSVWDWYVAAGSGANAHPYKPTDTFSSADIIAMNNGTYSYPINTVDNPTGSPVILSQGSSISIMPESPKTFTADVVPSCRAASIRGDLNLTQNAVGVYMYTDKNNSDNLPQLTIKAGYSGDPGNVGGTLYKTSDTLLLNPLETKHIVATPAGTPNPITFAAYGKGSYVFKYDDHVANSYIDSSSAKYVSMAASPMELLTKIKSYSLTVGCEIRYYFYVPKGTKFAEMHAGSLGSGSINGLKFYNASNTAKTFYEQDGQGNSSANETVTGQFRTNGAYAANMDIIIPVTGDDDQIWSVRTSSAYTIMNVQKFWFWNIPGLLARNTDELVIPREAYSNLKPANQSASATTGWFYYTRGKIHLYIYTNGSGNLPTLSISDGWSGNGAAAATWSLYKEKDDLVAANLLQSGTVATDQAYHPVALTASAGAGCYHFVYDDSMNSSVITWPSGSLVLQAANPQEPLVSYSYADYRYFYVPKGTQCVQMKASAIGACTFYNAAGGVKRTQPVDNNNPVISISVGAGEDGQVWKVTGFSATNFCFVNLPGFSVNANQLLVPQWVSNQIQNLW